MSSFAHTQQESEVITPEGVAITIDSSCNEHVCNRQKFAFSKYASLMKEAVDKDDAEAVFTLIRERMLIGSALTTKAVAKVIDKKD